MRTLRPIHTLLMAQTYCRLRVTQQATASPHTLRVYINIAAIDRWHESIFTLRPSKWVGGASQRHKGHI